MGGTAWQQGSPCSQLIRGGNGHWSQGNCFVFLSCWGGGSTGRPFPAAAAVHRHSHSHVGPALSCLDAHAAVGNVPPEPGDKQPPRTPRWRSFSTRDNQSSVPARPSPLQASPSGTAAHTEAGTKKGDLPRGKPALPFVQTTPLPRSDALAPIPSSPATLSLPLHRGGLATRLVLTQTRHCRPMQA